MSKIKRVGVLTSGGDAPGMNAAIRAVTRAALYYNLEVFGILKGYNGLVDGNFVKLSTSDVSNIIQRGGTILKSARSLTFKTVEGRKKAYDNLVKAEIDALVVIGGDGTFTGARIFASEFNYPIVGLPGTIDNDLFGTDYTIGYDTALNTILEAVDRIRDTASSHERLFFVEVMGRDAGFLALNGGIAGGAEAVLIPETDTPIEMLEEFLKNGFSKPKHSSIVLVAEGDQAGGALKIGKLIEEKYPEYNVGITILGHVQRGGKPTALDRIIASRMGLAAIDALLDDQKSIMIGIQNDDIVHVSFSKAIKNEKPVHPDLLMVQQIMST